MFGIRDIDIWFPAEASQYIGVWESAPCRVTFFHYFCTWNERTKAHTGIQRRGTVADPALGLCGQKSAYPSRWVLPLPHGERRKYHVVGSCGRLCDLPFPLLLIHSFHRLGTRQWVPAARNLFPPGKLHPFNHRSTGYATPRTACNRVNKSVPGPPASGSIRPHAPTGAAKQSFSQGILSHRPHCCGRSPCPAKTVLFIHNYAIICFSVPFKEA